MIKNCLQCKGVLYESNLIEVGYVHYQKGQQLDFTLFLTPKTNLEYIRLKIKGDNNMITKVSNDEIEGIKGKQEIIKIET